MSNLATITNNILADSGIDDINVVVTTGSYANPAWITSLAWTKITGAPSNIVTGTGLTNRVAKFDSNGSTVTYGLIYDDGSSIETNAYTYITKTLIPRQATSYATNFKSLINATAGWIYLGNLTIPQQGYNACITMDAGLGFNASLSQMGYVKLHIRTSNTTPSGGFHFVAFAEQFGYSNFIQQIRITENISTNTLGIYVYCIQFVGSGYYKVEGHGIEYIPVETATAPPSTYYQVPLAFTVNSDTTINNVLTANSNLNVAGNTELVGRLRIQGGSDEGSQLNLWADSNGHTFLAGYNFSINTGSNSSRTQKFFISNTGDATFSSSVMASQLLLRNNSDSEFINIGQSTGNQKQLIIGSTYASNLFYIQGIHQNVSYNQNIALNALGGNVLIGSSTNVGSSRLQVTGDAMISNVLLAGGATNIDSSLAVQISSAGGGTQKWFGANKNGSYGLLLGYSETVGLSGVGAYIRQVTSDPLFFVVNNATTALTLDSTGAATFSSNLAVNGNKITLGSQEDIVSTSGLLLGSGFSTIEMVASNFATGYGAKIEQADPGDGFTYTRLFGRANTTTWTQHFQVNNSTGAATFSSLAGSGTRMVVADANGLLSTQAIGSGAITGSGATNTIPKFTGASTIGNSSIVDNALNVTIAKNNGVNDIGLVIQQTANFTASYIQLAANNDGGAGYNFIQSVTNGGSNHWQIGGGGLANTLMLFTGGTKRIIIDSSGNTSIGYTTNPSTHLIDVNGTGRFIGNVTINNTLTVTQSTAETASIVATSGWSGTINNPIITFGRLALAVAGTIGYDDPNTGLYIGTTTNHRFAIRTNNSDRLTISNAGAATFSSTVNINGATIITADAGNEQLTIRRASNTNEQLIFGFHSSDYARIQAVEQGVSYRPLALQQDGGNLLIGTTSDVGSKLYVDGGMRASGAIVGGGLLEFTGGWSASPYNASSWIRPASGVGIFLVNNAITKWAGFKPNSDFDINGGNFYVHSSNGNVGVGTDVDSGYRLDVAGTLRATGIIRAEKGISYQGGIINVTGGSSSWINLGTISIPQGGDTAVITIEGGAGYNADNGQNASSRIFIRTSNGSPNGSGWFFSAYLTQMGYNASMITDCIISQVNSTTYTVYVNFGTYSGNTYYKIEGSSYGWTASNSNHGGTAPSGFTLPKIFNVISPSTFASNVDIGGNTELVGRLRIQGGSDEGSQLNLWANSNGNTFLAGYNFSINTGSNNSRTQRFFISNTGVSTFSSSVTATSFFESSDSRIKKLLEDKLDYQSIASVTAKYYEKNGKIELGYFAQDFETLLPSAVSKNEDGYLNLSYREVHTAKIAYLEKEIKELKEQLKNK